MIDFDGTLNNGFTYDDYCEWVCRRGTPNYILDDSGGKVACIMRGVAGLAAEYAEFVHAMEFYDYCCGGVIDTEPSKAIDSILSEGGDVYFWLSYLCWGLGVTLKTDKVSLHDTAFDKLAHLADTAEKYTRSNDDLTKLDIRLDGFTVALSAIAMDVSDTLTYLDLSWKDAAQNNFDKLEARRPDLTISA